MKYSEFKKEAGIVDWATDKILGGYFGKDNYQKRQDAYNEIKNQPDANPSPYTVTETTPASNMKAQAPTAQTNPNHVIPANAFNNDAYNNIQDAATRDAYTDFITRGGALAQQLQDTNYDVSKLNLNDIASNPNVADSMGAALENATPAALDSFVRVGKQLQKASANSGTSNGGGNTSTAAGLDALKDKLTGSFVKGLWNNVKANPIQMIPQIAGMFLKQMGAGKGIVDFASNPLSFYLSLAGLLLGGGLLLSGGGNDSQPQVVNNYYGAPQPAGYNRIPYM